MMRVGLIWLMLMVSVPVYAFSWRDLWVTKDQQGEKLMSLGQFSKAKDTFSNKSWAAAAAYRSGNYEQAASLFHDLHTEQGYYNEGNALAHMGQYEKAMDAYNRSLDIDPNDKDALYNKALVEALLKKDKEKQPNKKSEQNNKNQQNQDKKESEQNQKQAEDKTQQDKKQSDKNKQKSNPQQQNENQSKKQQQEKQNKQEQEKQNKANNKTKQAEKKQSKKDKSTGTSMSNEEQEKKTAKEQWLQLIPDDPGGLLREKFLRDHLKRERGWYQ